MVLRSYIAEGLSDFWTRKAGPKKPLVVLVLVVIGNKPPTYSRVIFILDIVVVGEFDRLVAESMHSLVYHLSVLLVTAVNIQLVLSSASQPASIAFTRGTGEESIKGKGNGRVLATALLT